MRISLNIAQKQRYTMVALFQSVYLRQQHSDLCIIVYATDFRCSSLFNGGVGVSHPEPRTPKFIKYALQTTIVVFLRKKNSGTQRCRYYDQYSSATSMVQ